MKEIDELLGILERLLAPDGCPWDREQTLQSMRHSLVEETYEVIEAIDLDHVQQLKEELGDLLFNVFFLCRLAEKEGRFTLSDAVKGVNEKLIRRHPHIFGDVKLSDSSEVLKQWENIKEKEKKHPSTKSSLDGIPKDLPSLARAQKIVNKLDHREFTTPTPNSLSVEDQAGEDLWIMIQKMNKQGIKAEDALRKRLMQIESQFRDWEQKEKK